jgi:drug/metabolite transporter (DMT)-like permease
MSEKQHFPKVPPSAGVVLPVGVVAISFASILIKLCDAPPLIIAAYRLTLATVILFLWTIPRRRHWEGLRFLPLRDVLASLLAGLFLCFHFAFWITSLRYTSVASSVIFVTTNPIFIGLLSLFLFREALSAALLGSILLAVGGGILIGWGDWSKGVPSLTGDLLALLGALMASGYLLMGRRVRQRMDLALYITIVYATASFALILLAWASGQPFFAYPLRTYFLLFLIALVPQLIGHTCLNWALKFFSATLVAVFILGEPIGATTLAYLLLGEPLSGTLVGGGVLVLLGIYFASCEERKLGKF